MNKLEEDYSYIALQKRLAEQRAMREQVEISIAATMRHINAIKRDFKEYEENQ